jgi:hypothetical protein
MEDQVTRKRTRDAGRGEGNRRRLGPSKLEAMEEIWAKGYTIAPRASDGKLALFRLELLENYFRNGMSQYDNLSREERDQWKGQ